MNPLSPPSRRSRRTRRTRVAALGAVAALALTGCGIHPGQAAVVGDTDISPDEVDATASVVCLIDQSVNGVRSTARSVAVEFLVGSELVEAFGRSERAIPTGAELSSSPALDQIQQEAQAQPAAVRQDYVDTLTRLLASQQTLINVGQREAQSGGTAAGDVDAALAAGSTAYGQWLEQQSPAVSVDPRYGEWEGARLLPGDSSLSVAVSEQAQQLAQGAAELPATQVCS